MRYGIVRDCPGLPPADTQRHLLEAAACDVILEEADPTPEAQRRLQRLLFALKPGDEVVVHSLEVFQRSTGELAQLIRNFLEMDVTLRIADETAEVESVVPDEPVLRLLSLLAEHESRRPSRTAAPLFRANGGSKRPLSRYQVEYARKLHRQGASLRSIGLLFQVPPEVVWEEIGR